MYSLLILYSIFSFSHVFTNCILNYVCLGESDDDREELYKAANAASNASSVYLDPFYLFSRFLIYLHYVSLFSIQFYV